MFRSLIAAIVALFLISVFSPYSVFAVGRSQQDQTPDAQLDHLRDFEAQIIHKTNLKRRENGLPPLRWNRQLTEAARWFSRDVVVDQGGSHCGHTDSLGRGPGQRIRDFGYSRAVTWTEHVVCGYAMPSAAVEGWYRNEEYRRQMLSPDVREMGVGYYLDPESGAGHITGILSSDPEFSPVVIEFEALNSASAAVDLYIYSPTTNAELDGIGPATAMMIANEPTFSNAVWQPFSTIARWDLSAGAGRKDVYVKTRDALGRTKIAHDSIFLGEHVDASQITLGQASSGVAALTVTGLKNDLWPRVLLRLNWLVNDGSPSIRPVAGHSERIADELAGDGSTYRLHGSSNAHIRFSTPNFYRDVPLSAYLRLRVDENSSDTVVLEVKVDGGGVLYGPLELKASQFERAGQYQEFALPFEFHDNAASRYLIFDIKASGDQSVYLDHMTFYQRDVAMDAEIDWVLPKEYDRGSGVWARYEADPGRFSEEIAINPLSGAAAHDLSPPAHTPVPAHLLPHPHRIYLPINLAGN